MERAAVRLQVLGHTELAGAGNRTGSIVLRQPKRLALLAYIALTTADGYRRRDQIATMFWPESDQFHARTQLRKILHALRSAIGPDAVLTRGEDEIRLNPARVSCDAVEFRRAIENRQWLEAAAIYRGDFLEGLFPGGVGEEFQSWLADRRFELRELAARAAWESSNLADVSGRRDDAIALARRAFELNPDDEEAVRRLIAMLDRYGDRAGAMRLFSDWQARLESEFETVPAPETRRLIRRVQAPRKGESAETLPLLRSLEPTNPAVLTQAPTSAAQTVHKWRRRDLITIASTAIVVVLLAIMGMRSTGVVRSRPPAMPTIAVLPFRGFGDSTAAIIGQSVTEELIAALARTSGLVVRSSARSQDTVVGQGDLAAIGSSLDVSHLVDGSIRHETGRVRAIVRLVRVADRATVWANAFDSSALGTLAGQEALARASVEAITASLGLQGPPRSRP